MVTRCEKCSSYYDIPWDIQRDAAIWLENSQKWEVTWMGDGLWKVIRKGTKDDREKLMGILTIGKLTIAEKTFKTVEYLTPKTIVDTYRRLMDAYKKSRGYDTDEEAKGEKAKAKRGRKPKVELSSHQGKPDGDDAGDEVLVRNSNKRRRKQTRRSGDGKRAGAVSGAVAPKPARRPRKKAKAVRKRVSRVRKV